MNFLRLSKHAQRRARKRLNLDKYAALREAEKAFWLGERSNNAKSYDIRVILARKLINENDIAILHHGIVWIINTNNMVVITAFIAPKSPTSVSSRVNAA